MEINDIKTLIVEVGHISNHYREIAKVTGEDFNVFNILGLQASEVRLHSAILTDLLNPIGSHGQGDLFLKIFVRQLKIVDFDTKSAIAEYEKNAGFIDDDYTKGGRIDILITDKNNKHIIIENKIYAGDQKNQLLRYYNYDREAYLFYLNLCGVKPSDFSANTLSESQYSVISYGYDVIEWLEECKRNAASLPVIRETITQYINLLKQLTNQATGEKMKDEIKRIIADNPDYIDSIELCLQVVQSTIHETKTQFKDLFDSLFPCKVIYSENDFSIEVHWGEDGDGIYFGYQLIKGGENISGSDIALKYKKIFEDIDGLKLYSNRWYLAWFNPEAIRRGQRFEHLDKKEIFKMNSSADYLKSFVMGMIQCENDLRKEFLNRIDKKK